MKVIFIVLWSLLNDSKSAAIKKFKKQFITHGHGTAFINNSDRESIEKEPLMPKTKDQAALFTGKYKIDKKGTKYHIFKYFSQTTFREKEKEECACGISITTQAET